MQDLFFIYFNIKMGRNTRKWAAVKLNVCHGGWNYFFVYGILLVLLLRNGNDDNHPQTCFAFQWSDAIQATVGGPIDTFCPPRQLLSAFLTRKGI